MAALLILSLLAWGSSAVSAQESGGSSDCSESLGTLSAGEETHTGTASASCTRYLPHGYSYVVDNGVGSAKAFTFTLDAAATVTITLDHGSSYDSADRPILELIKGHHDHTTAVGTLLNRAVDTHDLSAPVTVGILLRAGDYTAQIANHNWQWGGAFTYSLTVDVDTAEVDSSKATIFGTTENTFRENFTGTAAAYGISASDGDDIAWSLTGDDSGDLDSGDFAISSEGTLTFAATPDYEIPADEDGNNVYEFTVSVTRTSEDDVTYTGSLSVEFSVTDLDESRDDSPGGV